MRPLRKLITAMINLLKGFSSYKNEMVLAGQEKGINKPFVLLFIAIYILITRSRFIRYHLNLEKNKFTIVQNITRVHKSRNAPAFIIFPVFILHALGTYSHI